MNERPVMSGAATFWYVLGCISFGLAYFRKVPVKKALSQLGLVELTAAEKFWYVFGCVAFGAAYFSKVAVLKALSELPQYRQLEVPTARLELRRAPDTPLG